MNKKNPIINISVLLVLFICYTLKFLVPAFYALTDKYAGLFVFLCEGILFLNNYDFIAALKNKNREFRLFCALIIITGLNLVIVHSGFGAFFTVANFALAFFMSDKLILNKKQVTILAAAYMIMFIFWLAVVYPPYFGSYDALFPMNTNGAATFSIYTALIALVILYILREKHEFIAYFILLLFIRSYRLSLWHRARGSFIILTMFILLFYIAGDRFLKNKKIYTAITYLMTFGSLVFVLVYTFVGRLGVNIAVPLFYKNLFSGREDIWYEFLTYFIRKPITGIGTNLTIESFFEFNVHNAMYDILVIHGIVVFLLVMYFVIKRFGQAREKALQNKIPMLALCVLISVFFESFIDVDLIWADYSANLIVLLAMVNADYTESSKASN